MIRALINSDQSILYFLHKVGPAFWQVEPFNGWLFLKISLFAYLFLRAHTEIEAICKLACGAHLTYLLWSIWYNANTVTPFIDWHSAESDPHLTVTIWTETPNFAMTYIFLFLKKYCALQMLLQSLLLEMEVFIFVRSLLLNFMNLESWLDNCTTILQASRGVYPFSCSHQSPN